jgi:cytochrome c oxidase assembly factor 2
MIMTADGQQIQRVRRRRRKDAEATTQDECMPARTPLASEEEVSTFLQLEEEAALLSKPGRECPVPKPTGMLGDLLGFSKRPFTQTPQTENRQPDVEGRRSQ